jgi:integrase
MPNPSDGPEKRKPITSDLSARSAPPGDNPVAGVRGVSFRVRATKKGALTRRWIWRAPNKKRSPRTIGHFPVVGLGEAKRKAVEFDREFAAGIDPGVRAKRRQRASEAARTLSLATAIDGSPSPPYKNPKSDEIRERALRVHFAPLHARDVTMITTADVANILRTLADQTAIKAHTAIRRVFDYAITTLEPHGVPMINPADPRRLRSVGWSPKPQSESASHAAVDWRIMPEVVAELSAAEDAVSACTLLMIATALRAKTARLAKWRNFVFDPKRKKSTWTPLFADLKEKHHKRPFIIPLNVVALDALDRMRARSSSPYVFANSSGGPITEGDITNLIRRLRRRHDDWRDPHSDELFTVHGFRSSFRTWAEETHRVDSALGELSLGHRLHGEVAARYIRTGLVEERRALLDAWSRHLRGESAKIITLRQG